MTRTRNVILAAGALVTLGAAALSTAEASASSLHWHRAHHDAGAVAPGRIVGPAKRSCLVKQVRPDGTVVLVDRCTQGGTIGPAPR